MIENIQKFNREVSLERFKSHSTNPNITIGKYTEIIGYTILGSIILFSPETNEYLLLHPRMPGNNAKFYGEFESISVAADYFMQYKKPLQVYSSSPFNWISLYLYVIQLKTDKFVYLVYNDE